MLHMPRLVDRGAENDCDRHSHTDTTSIYIWTKHIYASISFFYIDLEKAYDKLN